MRLLAVFDLLLTLDIEVSTEEEEEEYNFFLLFAQDSLPPPLYLFTVSGW